MGEGGGLFQRFFGAFAGAHYEKPFLCPRQGDIEKPHFFALILPRLAARDGEAGKRRIAHAVLQIHHPRPEAEFRVYQHRAAAVAGIEAARGIAQKHHWVFEPLGAVDGDDLHGPARTGSDVRLLSPACQCLQPKRQAVQTPIAGAFKTLGKLGERHEIFPAPRAVVHGAAQGQKVELFNHKPHGLGCAQVDRLGAQSGEKRQKRAAFVIGFPGGLKRCEKVGVPVGGADEGQLVRRKAEGCRAQHGNQRDVFVGVVHDREHTEYQRDLRRLKKAAALCAAYRDAQIHERFAVHAAGFVRRAQKDRNIAVVHGPCTGAVRYRAVHRYRLR